MTPEQSFAFFVFSLVAAITPGPSNVMLTATGAAVGVWRGLPCLIGVGLLIFVVALGLGQVVLQSPFLLQALNWAGAAFLLWLAWKIASSGRAGDGAAPKPVGLIEAALFQWVNPKSWLVSASAAGTYLHAGTDSALPQALAFAGLFLSAAAPSGLAWLAFGAAMHRLLRSERAARIFNLAMGLSLAASVALILW